MKLLVLLVIAVAMPLSASADRPDFEYIGWLDRDTIQFYVSSENGEDARIGYHDALNIAELCDAKSDYICFFTLRLAFAVPKRIDPPTDDWTVRGQKFELVERGLSVSLLGRKLENLFLIRSPASATQRGKRSGKAVYYLYSQEIGLVGFGDDPALEPSTAYWLTGTRGFGGDTQ